MITPFDSPMISNEDMLCEYGRNTYFVTLDSIFKMNPVPNIFIHSPFGTGKTTLLTHYFSEEKKRELLQKGVLVQFCHFTGSQMRSDSAVYSCLIDSVTNGLQLLYNQPQTHEKLSADFKDLKKEQQNYRTDENIGAELLHLMLQKLKMAGFHMVLVFDNFQDLTCSDCCSVHTFNYMSSLAQERVVTFVVATDFHSKVASKAYGLSDFERVFDSRLKLDGISSAESNPVNIRKLQRKIRTILKNFQKECGIKSSKMIEISDEEIQWLWEDTAGIPGLLQNGMKAYYTARCNSWICESREAFDQVIYSGCESIMLYWTKYFNNDYWFALNDIFKNRSLESEGAFSTEQKKRNALVDSGLVTAAYNYGEYRFICPLFERYISKELKRREKDIQKTQTIYSQTEKHDVFISYKHSTDESRVAEVVNYLHNNGLSTFYDKFLPEKSDPDYHTALYDSLAKARHFVVLISNYRLITASKQELTGDWVNLEMCIFKKMIDEGRKKGGRFILLVADEIFDTIIKSNKKDLNIMWDQNTEIMPWRDYKSKLINYLK